MWGQISQQRVLFIWPKEVPKSGPSQWQLCLNRNISRPLPRKTESTRARSWASHSTTALWPRRCTANYLPHVAQTSSLLSGSSAAFTQVSEQRNSGLVLKITSKRVRARQFGPVCAFRRASVAVRAHVAQSPSRWRGRRNDHFPKGWQLMKSRITECSIITSDSLSFFLSHTAGNFFFFLFFFLATNGKRGRVTAVHVRIRQKDYFHCTLWPQRLNCEALC